MSITSKIVIVSFLASRILFNSAPCLGAVKEEYWLIKKSMHFIVYYKGEDSSLQIDRLLKDAEANYEEITEALGFKIFDFWTWDKRCKIYLFPSANAYYNDTGRPIWSAAHANFQEKAIKTYTLDKDFFEKILPHEMSHLILREFIGINTYLPLWLEEGIASLSEKSGREERLTIVKGLARGNLLIPLDKLTNITADNLVMPKIFYAESLSIVYFLLKKYGRDKFVDLCRDLRDKKEWEDAIENVYGFRGISSIGEEWLKFMVSYTSI